MRSAAATRLKDFSSALQPADQREGLLMQHLIPHVKELVVDPNTHVKTALAGVIMGLAPLLGKDKYICLTIEITA